METFIFQLPKCFLGEGVYSIDLIAHNASNLEMVDSIENVLRFSMLPSDLYKSGNLVGKFYGSVQLPNEWLTSDFKPYKKTGVF